VEASGGSQGDRVEAGRRFDLPSEDLKSEEDLTRGDRIIRSSSRCTPPCASTKVDAAAI
jgi:hypothetical protein